MGCTTLERIMRHTFWEMDDLTYVNGRPRSIHESCPMEDLRNFFILHRIWRSEIEYISRLGQGLNLERTGRAVSCFELKENQQGFLISSIYEQDSVFEIQNQILMKYEEGYQEFLNTCDLVFSIKEAQEFIIDRAGLVWRELPAARASNPRLVEKLLRNVAVDQVEAILDPEGEFSQDSTFIPRRRRLQFWLERSARRLPAPLKPPLRAVRGFVRGVSSRLNGRP